MNETYERTTERVDDVPLLIEQMRQMQLPSLLNSYFPSHGNRQGLSLGWTITVWLTHIRSQGDHRLNHVRPWVESLTETRHRTTGQPITPLDVTDDRLADVLRYLSNDEHGHAFERALTRNTIRVYDLRPERVRVDTTSISSYGTVTDDGLLPFGFSRDRRPDLPQGQVLLADLDPLGMPIVTEVVSGEQPDDPWYVPAIERVQSSLQQKGLWYVGDVKMGSRATRAVLQRSGDVYRCPLSRSQVDERQMNRWLDRVLADPSGLTPISRTAADGSTREIAVAVESPNLIAVTFQDEGWADREVVWTERRVLVRSHGQAKAGSRAWHRRIDQALDDLLRLNRPRRGQPRRVDGAMAQEAVDAILRQHRGDGLIQVSIAEYSSLQRVRGYRGHPAEERRTGTVVVTPTVESQAVAAAEARLGGCGRCFSAGAIHGSIVGGYGNTKQEKQERNMQNGSLHR